MSKRTVLYTGAAGGLGLPATLALIDAGWTVVALDHDPGKLDALVAAASGHPALIVRDLDLSDLTGLRGELDRLVGQLGGFDAVVNNAAIYPSKAFEDFTIEDYQAVQRVNVEAGVVCVQAALPGMRRKGWGRVVNIASITVYGGWPLLSPYVASKATLVGLTRAWAREFGPYGVTVNAIAPGAFPTDAEKIHPDPEGYKRFVLDHQSVKRRGQPGDIAHALLFFVSEESGFVTGQILNVDGGWVMH